jgi:hypothetical protein
MPAETDVSTPEATPAPTSELPPPLAPTPALAERGIEPDGDEKLPSEAPEARAVALESAFRTLLTAITPPLAPTPALAPELTRAAPSLPSPEPKKRKPRADTKEGKLLKLFAELAERGDSEFQREMLPEKVLAVAKPLYKRRYDGVVLTVEDKRTLMRAYNKYWASRPE